MTDLLATQRFDTKDTAREMAVLFADIAGSTRLYETLGDTVAKALIDEALRVMTQITERHKGRVVKTIGDEIMCVFPGAEAAYLAATDMQLKIDALPELTASNTRVKRAIRVGFQTGPVLEQPDGDVFGDTVNVAARMAGIAKGQQIITTAECIARLPPMLRAGTRPIAALAVKGKADDMAVAEVLWNTSDDLTMAANSLLTTTRTTLKLKHGARELVLETAGDAVTFGRDATCDFMIADPKASRVHARLEFRRDKFYVVDQSTNGTFVTIGNDAEMALRREELMLRANGKIVFGHTGREDSGEAVWFEVG